MSERRLPESILTICSSSPYSTENVFSHWIWLPSTSGRACDRSALAMVPKAESRRLDDPATARLYAPAGAERWSSRCVGEDRRGNARSSSSRSDGRQTQMMPTLTSTVDQRMTSKKSQVGFVVPAEKSSARSRRMLTTVTL